MLRAMDEALEKLLTGRPRDEPAGEEWDEDKVDELYPRLAAKFG